MVEQSHAKKRLQLQSGRWTRSRRQRRRESRSRQTPHRTPSWRGSWQRSWKAECMPRSASSLELPCAVMVHCGRRFKRPDFQREHLGESVSYCSKKCKRIRFLAHTPLLTIRCILVSGDDGTLGGRQCCGHSGADQEGSQRRCHQPGWPCCRGAPQCFTPCWLVISFSLCCNHEALTSTVLRPCTLLHWWTTTLCDVARWGLFKNCSSTEDKECCMQIKIEAEEGDDDEDMDDDSNDDEEVIVPEGVNVDPAVLSTLPPSMQVRRNVPDSSD